MVLKKVYLSSKKKIDEVVPKTQPNVSRLPVIQNQHVPVTARTSQTKELELQTVPTTQKMRKCEKVLLLSFEQMIAWKN